MTTLIRGRSTPLTVEWFQYPGGPPDVVNNVMITITPLDGGVAVVGPTTTGVTNPAIGVNAYQWNVPSNISLGDYLVVWNGEDLGMSVVQASEIIIVVGSATSATSGPCETWDPIWCCDLLESAAVTGTALEAATEVLYSLSGHRFGICQLELWPCRRSCFGDIWPFGSNWWQWGGSSSYYPQPALIAGMWFNLTCGQCADQCSCTTLSQVKLPTPVSEVVEVRVDNVVLTPDVDYRLDNYNMLTRLGGDEWPLCNDFSQTAGTGTWSVTIRIGEEVPQLGKMAVGELACEFAKACLGQECRLPQPLTSLARQGISMSFVDPNALFAEGRIGLYFSDLFIATYNPKRRLSRSRVYDIDSPEPWQLGV